MSSLPVPVLTGDIAPSYKPKSAEAIKSLRTLEAAIPHVLEEIPIDSLTKHAFCDGVYRREFFLPKGAVVVSKIHRIENWFLLFSGEVSIASGDGEVVRVKAPYMSKTQVDTKRAVYAHEDSVMFTFHGNPDNESDLDALENRYIEKESPATLPKHVLRALLERKTP